MYELANNFFPSSVAVKGVAGGNSATSATNIPPALQALPSGTIIKGNITGRNPAGDLLLQTPQGDLALKTNIFMKRGVEVSIKLEKAMDQLMAKILTIDNKSVSKYVNSLQNKQAGSEVLLQSTLQAFGKTDATGTAFTSSTPFKALLMPRLQQQLAPATQPQTGQTPQTSTATTPQTTPSTSTAYGNAASSSSATPQASQQGAATALSQLNYSAQSALSALPPKIAAIIAAATQGAELEVKVKSIQLAPPATGRNAATTPTQQTQTSVNTPQTAATTTANQTTTTSPQPQTVQTQPAQAAVSSTATNATQPVNATTAQATPPAAPVATQPATATTETAANTPARQTTAATANTPTSNEARSTATPLLPTNIANSSSTPTTAPAISNQTTQTLPPTPNQQTTTGQTTATQTTTGQTATPTPNAPSTSNAPIQNAPAAQTTPAATTPQTAAYNAPAQTAATASPVATTPTSAAAPIAQPTADAKATIPAIVIQASPNSAQTLQTPLGTLRLFIPTPLPLGTQLQLEVTAATPQALSAGMLAESIKELGGFDELQQVNLAALAEGKPPLATIPQATSKELTTDMLFFLSALKGGDVKKWLGDKTSKSLEINSSELLSRLTSEFGQLRGNQVEAKETGQWNLASIPMGYGQDVSPVHMYYRHNERESDENAKHDHTDHFVVDVNLTNLGAIQLDGFMTKPDNNKLSFDLLIRTDAALPNEVQQGIRSIYQDAQAITGFNGSMGFRVGANARLDLAREIAAQGNSQTPPPDMDALIV